MSQPSLLDHSAASLRQAFAASGIEGYRAKQVLHWVYERRAAGFEEMTNLNKALRGRLADEWGFHSLALEQVHESSDGTRKLVLGTGAQATSPSERIEAVIIPEEDRRTLCLSTQIGCSLDCSFCATGRMKLVRNLRTDEIVDQLVHANAVLAPQDERITHIVYMGMGEPLLNLSNVIQSIRVFTDPEAGGLSTRRVTVSTAGVVPKLEELSSAVSTRLAISLHATTNDVRDELVPLNKRFPIETLLEACRRFPLPRRDRISFEYTLIKGVNDSPEDARRLVRLLHGIRAKINLIPMNEHPASPYQRPEPERVERFVAALAKSRAPVSVRRSRGDDVYAACGQLAGLATRMIGETESAAATAASLSS